MGSNNDIFERELCYNLAMDLTTDTITGLVLDWLLKENYSKQHWDTVASEMREKANGDDGKEVELMATALRQFHNLYINKVVRDNNVLHDLLSRCFEKVDWDRLARHFLGSQAAAV